MASNNRTRQPVNPTREITRAAPGAGKAPTPQKTKKERLETLLKRKDGVSSALIQKELGWLPHTVRAAISGVRKGGETVECTPGKSGPVYRIIKEAAVQ
jgi:hypothetical protein